MVSALSVVLMLATAVLPVLMYVLPALCGMLIWYVSVLINKKYAVGVYFSTSFLSMLLLTDKETALAYALFFGFYPIIRDFFDKLPKALSVILKLVLFNICAVGVGVLGVFIFGVSAEEYYELGKWTIPFLLGLANVMFLMYENFMKKYRFFMEGIVNKTKKYFK